MVAVDPLLVQYTTLPMTEALCALLATWLACLLVSVPGESVDEPRSAAQQLLIGVVFGLCVLSRPTFWAFGVLLALGWLITSVRFGRAGAIVKALPVWTLVGLIATVSPWIVRNALVFGRPIVTTTHSGYTLLLGNNPVFYQQEINQPWGTVWEDAPPEQSQETWYATVLTEMRADIGDDAGEVEVDRWMSRRAYRHIAAEPALFLKACLHRFLRFWSASPQRPALGSLPAIAKWSVWFFYSLVIVGFVLGLARIGRLRNRRDWSPVLLLVVSFTLVHLVYWSNIRMRAPVVPLIALVSAYGWERVARRRQGHSDAPKPG
jgi:hypothetical protein